MRLGLTVLAGDLSKLDRKWYAEVVKDMGKNPEYYTAENGWTEAAQIDFKKRLDNKP